MLQSPAGADLRTNPAMGHAELEGLLGSIEVITEFLRHPDLDNIIWDHGYGALIQPTPKHPNGQILYFRCNDTFPVVAGWFMNQYENGHRKYCGISQNDWNRLPLEGRRIVESCLQAHLWAKQEYPELWVEQYRPHPWSHFWHHTAHQLPNGVFYNHYQSEWDAAIHELYRNEYAKYRQDHQ